MAGQQLECASQTVQHWDLSWGLLGTLVRYQSGVCSGIYHARIDNVGEVLSGLCDSSQVIRTPEGFLDLSNRRRFVILRVKSGIVWSTSSKLRIQLVVALYNHEVVQKLCLSTLLE